MRARKDASGNDSANVNGGVYEARGDTARAAAHDERFIALWANADADLEPRVAETRRRLAGLGVTEAKR